LVQELGGFDWVCSDKLLHLNEDIEELSWRQGIEGTRDGIGTACSLWEVDSGWKVEWTILRGCLRRARGAIVE